MAAPAASPSPSRIRVVGDPAIQCGGRRGKCGSEDEGRRAERRERLVLDQRVADQAVHRNEAGVADQQ
jgi:hypothetical protein